MFKKIIIVLLVAIIAVLGFAATKPDDLDIQRSITINASADAIFPLINDMDNHPSWMPFAKEDPKVKRTHSGAESGKGEIYEWVGDSMTGSGRIETTESIPPSKVVMQLDMIKPLEAHNIVEFTLEPKDGGTNVTWAMRGKQPFIGKVMSIFFDCGKQFDEGLANLKAIAEKK